MHFTKSAEMSLSDATKPLLVVSKLFGINAKSYCHKIYTGLIVVCDLSLFCYVWQFHARQDFKNYHFQIFVHGMQDVCHVTSILLIWGSSIFDRRRFMVPLKDFVKVDQSLTSLGGCIDNTCIHRFAISYVITSGLSLIFLWLTAFSLRIFAETNEQLYIMLMLGMLYHSTVFIACSIVDCSFSVSLFAIRERFKEFPGKKTCVLALFKLIIYGQLILTNDAYGFYLLVGMITSFVLITGRLYLAYNQFTKTGISIVHAMARSINWVLIYVIRISALAQACESTVAEAKATSVALHKLRMEGNHSPATKEEIRDFFTQLQFEARNFTAYKFFDVNFSLVCGILGTACTYLVILIQMSDSSPCVITVNYNESILWQRT